MSERIGPMAWGQEGQVFLGEDLMHAARDYSDVTSRVIDEEVERILREQEARATRLLGEHRGAWPRSPPPCSRRRPSTGPRSAGWWTRPTAGRCTKTRRWFPASPSTRPVRHPRATQPHLS